MSKLYKHRHLKFGESPLSLPFKIINFGYHDFNYIKSSNVLHVQDGYTLHFVQKGCGTLQVGEKTYEVNKGDYFFLPPDVLMRYSPSKSEPWAYYWFYMVGDGAKELGLSMGFSLENPVRHETNEKEVDSLLNALFMPSVSQEERYFKTLSALYSVASRLSVSKNNAELISNSNIVERIKSIIKLNHKDPNFSVECLVDMVFVSQSYLCKLFKNKTGITPVKYLTKQRMKSAGAMLKEKNYTVKKLAKSVGYKDELHFMKEFKKEYGQTVKEFRKQFE